MAEEHSDKKKVEIHINNKSYEIERGEYSVSKLKELASIPLSDDFAELTNKKLKELSNDDKVHIKGGEQFFSHPHDGGSA